MFYKIETFVQDSMLTVTKTRFPITVTNLPNYYLLCTILNIRFHKTPNLRVRKIIQRRISTTSRNSFRILTRQNRVIKIKGYRIIWRMWNLKLKKMFRNTKLFMSKAVATDSCRLSQLKKSSWKCSNSSQTKKTSLSSSQISLALQILNKKNKIRSYKKIIQLLPIITTTSKLP